MCLVILFFILYSGGTVNDWSVRFALRVFSVTHFKTFDVKYSCQLHILLRDGCEMRKKFLLYFCKYHVNETKHNILDIVQEFLKRIK